MRIIITGTPGTGKTKTAKALEKYGIKNYNIKFLLEKCSEGYDKKRKTKVIDEIKLGREISKVFKKNDDVCIESHLSHYSSPRCCDLCVVLRTKPDVLKKRLKKRGYSEKKIKENIEAEAIDLILAEAVKRKFRVYEINTTGRKADDVAKEIFGALKKKKQRHGGVKWLDGLI